MLQDDIKAVEPPDVEISAQLVKCKFLGVPVYTDKVSNLNNNGMRWPCTSNGVSDRWVAVRSTCPVM